MLHICRPVIRGLDIPIGVIYRNIVEKLTTTGLNNLTILIFHLGLVSVEKKVNYRYWINYNWKTLTLSGLYNLVFFLKIEFTFTGQLVSIPTIFTHLIVKSVAQFVNVFLYKKCQKSSGGCQMQKSAILLISWKLNLEDL